MLTVAPSPFTLTLMRRSLDGRLDLSKIVVATLPVTTDGFPLLVLW
jgi:hypothetical protein